MHFELFFPGRSSNSAACLSEAGLADFVAGATEQVATINDRPGLLVGWGSEVGLDATRQRWVDVGQPYLLGLWTHEPLKPSDIQRPSVFNSHVPELADGNRWAVAIAAELPATLKLKGGHWTKVRKPAFDAYWQASERWYRRWLLFSLEPDQIREDAGLDDQGLLDEWTLFCVQALRQNYRITSEIASELGLLDETSLVRITFSAIDGMNIQEVQDELSRRHDAVEAGLEKKESAPLSTPA